MTDYLVAISIGPVQSLIEAGRRAQDLWCGSWLLSEVARAVALKLHTDQPNCLIFPNPENPNKELQPQSESDEPKANIANVIRAVISAESEAELKQKVKAAQDAAVDRLNIIFTHVLNEETLQRAGIDRERWQQQQRDVLETFSAWVSLANHDYKSASKRLGQLLQARKHTRDFTPIEDNLDGLHKSTLDGANNTVTHQLTARHAAKDLGISEETLSQKKRLLGLTNEEELDALGVVKRTAGKMEQFTPFSRVVAHNWLKELNAEQLEGLKAAYKPLQESGHVTAVSGNDGCYDDFPFDGEYLFLSRLDNADIEKTRKDTLRMQLQAIKSSPVSYGVLLKADGDRMGDLLKEANGEEQSRAISKALHEFATSVRNIVQKYGGHAIYAGGDDVLAFVPLAQAKDCAQRLAESFAQKMSGVIKELNIHLSDPPTLSVGLAIGHFVQPMRQLRQRAIAAEKYAKGNKEKMPRNALAIHLGIRSGHEITWRCRWDDKETLQTLSDFADAFAKGWMPTRIMQEVREMAQRLKWTEEQVNLAGIRKSELERMLGRAKPANGDDQIPQTLKSQLLSQASRHSFDELANQLVLARWLSAKTTNDIGGAE
jgi:CRISPR-associated protein Cmr2